MLAQRHSKVGIYAASMASALSVTAVIAPAEAVAQTGQTGLDEIVVTAQRREQNLQDVGVSVTALNSEQVKNFGLIDSKDIGKVAVGVVFDSAAGGSINNTLTIRGVSQSDFSPNQESPNSVYLDDVYISSPSAAGFTFFDLERIEVLRGPQGTLFGRASSGGLINYLSKRPSKEFEGYAEVGVGRFNQIYTEAAVGGSLSEKIRGRLSGRWERHDGYLRNRLPGGEDTFEKRAYGVRGQLEFDVTETATARLSVGYDRNPRHREGMYKTQVAYVGPDGQPAALPADVDAHGTGPGNDFAGYRDPYRDAHTAAFNNVGFFESKRFMPTLYLDWSGDAMSLSSITNYTRFTAGYDEDCDGGPIDFCNIPISQSLRQWSQEVRANGKTDRINWTAGVYYLNVDQRVSNAFIFPVLTGTDFAFDDVNPVHQKLSSYGIFGQLEYRFSEKLRGTIGARYTHDRKTFSSQVFFNELGNGYGGGTGSTIYDPPLIVYDFRSATAGSLARASKGMWSGKIQLDYLPNDDALIYASVSRGVKGPGFNINLGAALSNEQTPFKGEFLYAYEVGAKLDLLDRHVRLNTSIFYYDYHDFQGYAFTGLVGTVGNYDGYFKGGEIELVVSPERNSTIRLGVAYLDSKIRDVFGAYSGLRDMESIQAPHWTVNGLAQNSFAIGPGNLSLQWSFDYLSSRYASIDNSYATRVDGSFVHNARMSYDLPDQGLQLAVFVNNISDVDRLNYSFDLIASTGSLLRTYAKPRWWGASIKKTF